MQKIYTSATDVANENAKTKNDRNRSNDNFVYVVIIRKMIKIIDFDFYNKKILQIYKFRDKLYNNIK